MNFYTLPQNLSDLDHFRSDPMIQFKEETVDGVEVIIPCYMISTPELWQEKYALELRGHVYLKSTGELISAALPKFFNVGENAWTQSHNLPWDQISDIEDKRDGSMITFVVINGKVFAKTKKSFYSDVAILAQEYLDKNEHLQNHIKTMLDELDASPVYEFFHPEWKIVLNYGTEPTMSYLGYRDLENGSWIPADTDELKVDKDLILADIQKWQETAEGVEGVVVTFNDGRVVKLKTAWYLQQHRVKTDLRERDIAELAALGKLDDVKSVITESGMDMSLVEDIERRVAEKILGVKNGVEAVINEIDNVGQYVTAKEVANVYKNHRYFRMIMQKFRGQEPDYVEYFLKNDLKDNFKLNCVYNPKF